MVGHARVGSAVIVKAAVRPALFAVHDRTVAFDLYAVGYKLTVLTNNHPVKRIVPGLGSLIVIHRDALSDVHIVPGF